MGWLADETGLHRRKANYVPLTPLSHLNRAKEIYSNREALVYGDHRIDYSQYHDRVTRLASALNKIGVQSGDVVSSILPNIPAQVEAHFGVPACGAILNTINIRLDPSTVRYIIKHSTPRVILVDTQYLPLVESALGGSKKKRPIIIEVSDTSAGYTASNDYQEYEHLIAMGDPMYDWIMPEDEWESISLNYTSGTTGQPKGVVCHHRGSYLMTMGTIISWRMTLYPRFLAIVPLFHCNGWNHSWMIPVLGGTVYCCRDISARFIYKTIAREKITHFGGAPIILNMLANVDDADRFNFDHKVEVFTAGAPPASATLQSVEALNFNVTQVYGLTETYGHITECVWDDDLWGDLDKEARSTIKARQGVLFPMMEKVEVLRANGKTPIERDGTETGEIFIRGNSVMKGYYRNPEVSEEVFKTGYLASGDIAVQHPDGYIQITDRAKDIIITGGENVSSVEVEGILMRHPAVSLCAVVSKPDENWGEVPIAFVELKIGIESTEEELISFCKNFLAGFKVPKRVVFQELPKTATGKIQKFQLRSLASDL